MKNDTSKILSLSIFGAIAAFILIKFLPTIKKEYHAVLAKKSTLTIPAITIPALIDQNTIQSVVDDLKNINYSFTTNPVGWRLDWPEIPIDTPIGKVGLTIPSQQFPLVDEQQIKDALNKIKSQTTITNQGNYWKLNFPTITFNL